MEVGFVADYAYSALVIILGLIGAKVAFSLLKGVVKVVVLLAIAAAIVGLVGYLNA